MSHIMSMGVCIVSQLISIAECTNLTLYQKKITLYAAVWLSLLVVEILVWVLLHACREPE